MPTTTRTTCPYCGVGCVLDVAVENGRPVGIDPPRDAAPNYGMMCPKGALLHRSDAPERRATAPLMRASKDAPLEPTTWDTANRRVADALRSSPPDRLAWYGSGQLDTEASYLFTKLFKGGLGCNHTDTNSRLCMSSAVAGYKASFGSDGPPTAYDDIEHAEVFLIVGANMTANHPVLFNRVRRRRALHDGARVIVVDPRRTRTAELSDLHLPVAPGGDVALLRLLTLLLRDRGAADDGFTAAHTEGARGFHTLLDGLDRDTLLRESGVPLADLERAADWIADAGPRHGIDTGSGAPPLLSFYCMGTNQSSRGTDKNRALIDLHLILGAVGRVGAGPFSLTGQPNAMGGRECGYLAHQLPGYRDVRDADDRAAVEAAWGLPPGTIHPEPGRPAVRMFDDAAAGRIDLLWIACTNPAVSMPDLSVTRRALERTPLVVVQDCLHDTETAAYADVLLPAASWGEKHGTMTNSERGVARSRPGWDPPGRARPDWRIVRDIARACGFPGFDFATADDVWTEHIALTAGTPCDMSGLSNAVLDAAPGALQWPCPAGTTPRTDTRRYTDLTFPTGSGRARFSAARPAPPAEPTDAAFPLTLTTGRVAQHWHTRGRTGHVPELNRIVPEPVVDVHPDDADAAGLGAAEGAWVRVATRRGTGTARLRLTHAARRGTVFLPFHWGDTFAADTAANTLTHRAVDAVSQQPELKHAACRLEPIPTDPPTGPEGCRA